MDTRDDAVEDRSDDAPLADSRAADEPGGDGDDSARHGDSARHDDSPRTDRTAGSDPDVDARDDSSAPGLGEAFGDDRPELGPLEPGRPSVENVVFVVLGALATVLLFVTAL